MTEKLVVNFKKLVVNDERLVIKWTSQQAELYWVFCYINIVLYYVFSGIYLTIQGSPTTY